MNDDRASAPASLCTIAVRVADERRALLTLDPATTLAELLALLPGEGIEAPVATATSWAAGGPVPLDGSSCGPPKALRVADAASTLQTLGWFPSGVLVVEAAATAADAGGSASSAAPAKAPPSSLFAAVATRHDAAPALDAGTTRARVRTSAVDASADAARDAKARKTDAARRKAAGARDPKTAATLWRMMAKRHAVGRDGLREEDRHYLVVDRGDSPALYCFFSRQDTLGRATEAVAALLRVSPAAAALARAGDGATFRATDTLFALDGALPSFSCVSLVRGGGGAAAAPAAEGAAEGVAEASGVAEAAAPTAASPSSPSPPPPAGAYDLVVKYDKRDHTIAHLTPASTVAELKAAAAAATGVEPAAMKLIFKGDLARDDAKKLGDTALKPGAKILLMKTKPR